MPAGTPGADAHVLPDGCMDLMWIDDHVVVAGPDTAAHTVRRSPGAAAHGLRLHPGAAPALLGVPATALRDQRVPLTELDPAAADRTARAVDAGRDPLTALARLAHELRAGNGAPDPAVHAAARLIAAGRSVADTADALGWTVRTLHRRAGAAFGYGPTTLRRVLRFRVAVALLAAGRAPADVAAHAGYADQPHLSREIRDLSGLTAAALRPRPGQPVASSPAAGSGANRSTPLPSGSRTVA
ncbi:transcriptional regulator, AraC family [Pseudonocardia sp. N23]|nr:transcriptional regulator, AraC family [Pseudonocardia sp. N23]